MVGYQRKPEQTVRTQKPSYSIQLQRNVPRLGFQQLLWSQLWSLPKLAPYVRLWTPHPQRQRHRRRSLHVELTRHQTHLWSESVPEGKRARRTSLEHQHWHKGGPAEHRTQTAVPCVAAQIKRVQGMACHSGTLRKRHDYVLWMIPSTIIQYLKHLPISPTCLHPYRLSLSSTSLYTHLQL